MKKFTDTLFYIIAVLIVTTGIWLRTKYYTSDIPLWWDEIMLALSIIKENLFQVLTGLECGQKAPPLFVFFTYILTLVGKFNTFSLRFIPYISSVITLIISFLLSFKLYKHKPAILAALTLIAFNSTLTAYSIEFKPYSSDALIFLCIIYFTDKFDLKNKTIKDIVIISLITFSACSFSFQAIFAVPAAIITASLYNLKAPAMFSLPSNKIKIPIKALLPFLSVLLSVIYSAYIFRNILPVEINDLSWQACFIKLDSASICYILSDYFEFINIFFVKGFILAITGFILFIKEKNKNVLTITITMFFACIASFLKLYPLSGRIILYLCPPLLFFMAKTLDFRLKSNNIGKKITEFFIKFFIICMLFSSFPISNVFDIKKTVVMYEYEDRIKEDLIFKNFFNEYIPDEKIYSSIKSINYLEYYNKILNKNYDLICKEVVNYDYDQYFFEEITEIINKNYTWLIFDSLNEKEKISVYNTIKKYARDFKVFAKSDKIIIYKVNNRN